MCNGVEMNKPKVYVLLATYNGEKFLIEQLESLKNQVGCQVTVIALDDGSTDSTVSILERYRDFGLVESISHISSKGSTKVFFELLQSAPNGFSVAFCDQDDIWETNKISTLLSYQRDDVAQIIFSGRSTVDRDGYPIEVLDPPKRGLTWQNAIFENVIPGNTSILNPNAVKILKEFGSPTVAHYDSWIYLVGTLFCKIEYVEGSFIKYRIHSLNQVGLRRYTSISKHLKSMHNYLNQAEVLANLINKQSTKSLNKDVTSFLDFIHDIHSRRFVRRFRKCIRNGIYRQRKIDTLVIRFLLCFIISFRR